MEGKFDKVMGKCNKQVSSFTRQMSISFNSGFRTRAISAPADPRDSCDDSERDHLLENTEQVYNSPIILV